MAITNTNESTARSALSSCQWNLEMAMNNFMNSPGMYNMDGPAADPELQQVLKASLNQKNNSRQAAPDDDAQI